MTLLLAICAAVVFAVSVYLLLGRELKGVAMGVFLFSHAAHMGILAMSGEPVYRSAGTELPIKSPPILGLGPQLVDPLPQALILTSIVISFAVTAFLLTLLVTTHRRTGTLEVNALAGEDRPTPPEKDCNEQSASAA